MNGVSILLVEDNQDHAELEIRVIKKTGLAKNIDWVDDGKKALDYLFNREEFHDKDKYPTPDLILLDINLPHINGLNVLREIKKSAELEKIPVLAVSAQRDGKSMLEMLRNGAVDYVSKPFEVEELSARIGTHVKMSQIYNNMLKNEKMASLGVLAMGIAHEIKNRMNVISIAMHFIKEDAERTTAIERSISTIDNEIRRGITLINDLLQFSKPRNPCLEKVDLIELARATEQLVHEQLELFGIELIYENPESEIPTAAGDRAQLLRVMTNLFFNAIQAMPEGGKIVVQAGYYSKNTAMLFLSVTDSGIGIEEGNITRVFDPLYTTKPSGTGLGLSISQSIVKEHGGDIMAESKAGTGSKFSIILPVYDSKKVHDQLYSSISTQI